MTIRSAVVLAPCPFNADPRHGYWADQLRHERFRVSEVEVVENPLGWRNTAEMRLRGPRLSLFSSLPTDSQTFVSVMLREMTTDTSTGQYLKNQFLRTVAAVDLAAAVLLSSDLVIANDLAGAAAAVATCVVPGPKIVYDAQEIFTDSYDLLSGQPLSEAERRAWIRLETEVVRRVEQVVTVSPGIADLYDLRHDRRPAVLPNYVPERMFLDGDLFREQRPVRFVFLGRADPYRGLEELIDNWDFDPAVVTLDLFIPQSSAKRELVRRAGRARRNFAGPVFREPVEPDQIVKVLSRYDIGVLPYSYPAPYDQASPNKFGEYVAAGLAILANRQPFTSAVIERWNIGQVFEWRDFDSFKNAVAISLNPTTRLKWREHVYQARLEEISWDKAFKSAVGFNIEDTSSRGCQTPSFESSYEYRVGPVGVALATTMRRLIHRAGRRYLTRLGPVLVYVGRFKFVRKLMS